MNESLTRTRALVGLAARRDRVVASAWVAMLFLFIVLSSTATPGLYPTRADRVQASEVINSSTALVALYGPIVDVGDIGELSMTKATVVYAVFVAALAMMLVRRHSRVEEETGRAELVGATAVGTHARMAAASAWATLVVVVVTVLTWLGCLVGGLDPLGSLWFSLTWLGCGLVGVGLGQLTSQLSASARTCGLIGAGVLLTLFLLRAVGDVSADWLGWLTPFGWNTRLRAWSDEPRLWLFLAYLVLALVLSATALVLAGRRDLGSGLLADRPGPAAGAPRLRTVLSLAWREQASPLLVWTAVAFGMGLLMGSLVPSMTGLLDSEQGRVIIEALGGRGTLQDAALTAFLAMIGTMLAAYGVTGAVHAAGEEHAGRTEEVLATAATRRDTFGATALVSLVGVTWLFAVTGLAVGLGLASQVGDTVRTVVTVLGATLAHAPAAWVVSALALLCLGLRRTWAWGGWLLLLLFFVLGDLGQTLGLPDALMAVSPFWHVPKVPAQAMEWVPVTGLTLVAVVATLLGWWRYRSRDIG